MSAARRRKATRRSGARRGRPAPPGRWFLAGLALGLASSALLYFGGYLPERPQRQPATATPAQPAAEPELTENPRGIAAGEPQSRYDFFTVLPEMEVVVPEQELRRGSSPAETAAITDPGSYILQVGSFRSAADAEQLKARLALHGQVAEIQLVTVNDETWHRVRIGPVEGARRADEIRRSLQDNGFDTLVMKNN